MEHTAVIAARVHELRKGRGWSAEELAIRMTAAGMAWTRLVVTKLETGRRKSVSTEELLALAYVLDVAPIYLLLPWDDGAAYPVTPNTRARTGLVREWVRGTIEGSTLPGVDRFRYFAQQPKTATSRVRVVEEGADNG
jgi:transcriptional regulator with XRE-family HTH domain